MRLQELTRCAIALAVLVPLASVATPVFASVNIVDGDTIKVHGTTIRLAEIDTPESYQPRCEAELVLALKAKERLCQLLDSGTVTYKVTGFDRYGRTLAQVFAGENNVGKTLIKEGYALPYKPGSAAKLKRLRAWCGPNATLEDRFGETSASTLFAARRKNRSNQQTATSYGGPFPNCAAARAAGRAPLYAGDPGYQPKLDRDRDGVACE